MMQLYNSATRKKEEFKPLKKVHVFEKFVGGSPANIAVGVNKHGMKTGFIGKVSDDQFGDFVTEYFDEAGIDTSQITRCKDGEKLGEACALWTLVDAQSRRMIRPEDYGVDLKGLKTGEEGALPRAPEKLEQQESRIFTVPEEYLDLNGHMNNTRYYELAEASIGPDSGTQSSAGP